MKKVIALLLVALLTIGAAGCSMKGPTSSKSTGSQSTSGKKKIGFLIPTMQAEFFIGLADGLKAKCEAKGYELSTVSFDGDTAKAISAIENFEVSKVDVIIAMVSDNSCDSALKEAQNKGIKIFECGVETSVYDLCLLADNTDVGNKIGEMASDFINNKLGGKAKVAVFTTEQNIDMSRRGKGIVDTIKKLSPNADIVQVVDIGKDVVGAGTKTAEILLQKYPDLNVICGYGDMNTLEAVEAVKAAGKASDKFGAFSCDATTQGLKEIANGGIFRGTVYMGDLVQTMMDYTEKLLAGQEYKGKPVTFENIKITSENIKQYLK